ncbi:MAG: hypothetical protein JNL67_11495 [Planctomycetaceae bacterium]|nr:hypothetical protein [Planctomycetaceae bacterium]
MSIFSRAWKIRDWLLLDGLGATLTALSTGLLLATEVISSGLPPQTLWSMAAVAALFAGFDFWAVTNLPERSWPLAAIGVLNVCYCIGAIGVCTMHSQTLTVQGLVYFSLESSVVIPLGLVEIMIASRKA